MLCFECRFLPLELGFNVTIIFFRFIFGSRSIGLILSNLVLLIKVLVKDVVGLSYGLFLSEVAETQETFDVGTKAELSLLLSLVPLLVLGLALVPGSLHVFHVRIDPLWIDPLKTHMQMR